MMTRVEKSQKHQSHTVVAHTSAVNSGKKKTTFSMMIMTHTNGVCVRVETLVEIASDLACNRSESQRLRIRRLSILKYQRTNTHFFHVIFWLSLAGFSLWFTSIFFHTREFVFAYSKNSCLFVRVFARVACFFSLAHLRYFSIELQVFLSSFYTTCKISTFFYHRHIGEMGAKRMKRMRVPPLI